MLQATQLRYSLHQPSQPQLCYSGSWAMFWKVGYELKNDKHKFGIMKHESILCKDVRSEARC